MKTLESFSAAPDAFDRSMAEESAVPTDQMHTFEQQFTAFEELATPSESLPLPESLLNGTYVKMETDRDWNDHG